MGKKAWSRRCAKAIAPGGSQEGNTHAECMDSVGYGIYKSSSQGVAQQSGTSGGRRGFIRRGRTRG